MAAALLLAACGNTPAVVTTVTLGPGADSPRAAVEDLQRLLNGGEFAEAGSLAVPDQAALASLAEGASFADVAEGLAGDDATVASNFWSGFAQGVGDTLAGALTIEDAGTVSESGVEFSLVSVTPEAGTPQIIVTRDVDGHRIDIFASFGAGLAGRMVSPVETLLGSPSPDGKAILAALQGIVPSLLVAASDPDLGPEAVQEVLQLVEMITRVG